MVSPKRSELGIPVGILIIVIGAVGLIGLVGLGAWSLMGSIKLETIPLIGEWRAKDKPWRLEFRADKTVVSSKGASQPDAPQAWTSEPGTYRVRLFWHPMGQAEKWRHLLGGISASSWDDGAPQSQPLRSHRIRDGIGDRLQQDDSDESKASGFPKAAAALIPLPLLADDPRRKMGAHRGRKTLPSLGDGVAADLSARVKAPIRLTLRAWTASGVRASASSSSASSS